MSTVKNIYFSSLLAQLTATVKLKYTEFYPEQQELIYGARSGDVMGVLPTGFGKSVILEVIPFLEPGELHPVIGITPLNAILTGQKKKYGDHAIVIDTAVLEQVCEFGPQSETITRIIEGHFLYILGHPEFITDDRFLKGILRKVKASITHCVIDEAHCILSWGLSEFRPAFLKIATLRSTLHGVKFVALTATAARKSQLQIAEELRMINPLIISASPDRANLFIQVKARQPSTGSDHDPYDSIDYVIDPFIKELVVLKGSFPKTVVFGASLKWLGYCHHRTLNALYESGPTEKPPCVTDWHSELVAQYHAPQTNDMKELIMKDYADNDGKLRLLFASEAFSMGVDIQDIRRIVHLGPPKTLEVYAQEIGRCGRDGELGEIVTYYNKTDIRENCSHVDPIVRNFCHATTCRREILLDYFGFRKDDGQYVNKYKCCDICTGSGNCSTQEKRDIDKTVAQHLCRYIEHINHIHGGPLASLETGMSSSLAEDISRIQGPVTIELLKLEFPDMKDETIDNILAIMCALDLST